MPAIVSRTCASKSRSRRRSSAALAVYIPCRYAPLALPLGAPPRAPWKRQTVQPRTAGAWQGLWVLWFQQKAPLMSKRVILIILAIFSIGIAIFQAETKYADVAPPINYTKGVGYVLFPWFLGLIVALIKSGFQRIRKKASDFAGALVWATGVLLVIQVAVIAITSTAP